MFLLLSVGIYSQKLYNNFKWRKGYAEMEPF